MNSINIREHKDRFFRYLFGNPDYKENTLSLYNALNGTDYQNPEDIQLNTLENVYFVGMKNDISFVICDEIDIWEQQSSWNENIPLRELIYFVELIQKRIREQNRNILHFSKRYYIPLPKLYVFYNGEKDKPAEQWMYLKDSFIGDEKKKKLADPDIAVKVRMININSEESGNHTLLKKCQPLQEYAQLVQDIRDLQKEMDLETAVKTVLENIPKTYMISEAVAAAKEEIMSSILEEFDADRYEEDLKQIYREEGIEIGIEKGIEKGKVLGKQETKCTINSLFQQFNQGKSDEEIFRSGTSSSMEEIKEYRAMWKVAKESGL